MHPPVVLQADLHELVHETLKGARSARQGQDYVNELLLAVALLPLQADELDRRERPHEGDLRVAILLVAENVRIYYFFTEKYNKLFVLVVSMYVSSFLIEHFSLLKMYFNFFGSKF